MMELPPEEAVQLAGVPSRGTLGPKKMASEPTVTRGTHKGSLPTQRMTGVAAKAARKFNEASMKARTREREGVSGVVLEHHLIVQKSGIRFLDGVDGQKRVGDGDPRRWRTVRREDIEIQRVELCIQETNSLGRCM